MGFSPKGRFTEAHRRNDPEGRGKSGIWESPEKTETRGEIKSEVWWSPKRKQKPEAETNRRFGGAEGSRTPDLYNAIVALSQLSYGPK